MRTSFPRLRTQACPTEDVLHKEGFLGVRDVQVTTADGELLQGYAWAPPPRNVGRGGDSK